MAHINIFEDRVRAEWVDYNGHMNVAYYVLIFDHGTDDTLEMLELGKSYRERENKSFFVVESHVTYMNEVVEDDNVLVKTKVLGVDSKKIHLFHEMHHKNTGVLCATNEILALHVDMGLRKVAEMSKSSIKLVERAKISSIADGWPENSGRSISKLGV